MMVKIMRLLIPLHLQHKIGNKITKKKNTLSWGVEDPSRHKLIHFLTGFEAFEFLCFLVILQQIPETN